MEDATSALTGVYCFIAVEIVMKERLKKKKQSKLKYIAKSNCHQLVSRESETLHWD